MIRNVARYGIELAAAFALAGCAEQLPIMTWTAQPPMARPEGRIVVVSVINERPEKQGGAYPELVGNNRALAGIPYPVRLDGPTSVTDAMSRFLSEAASAAAMGIVVATDPAPTALLKGHLKELWCDGYPPIFKANLKLRLEVLDPGTQHSRAETEVTHHATAEACEPAIRALLASCFGVLVNALADPKIRAAAISPASTATQPAAVVLTPAVGPQTSIELGDGTTLEGQLVQQVPGQYVIVRDARGQIITVTWAMVRRITSGTLKPKLAPPGTSDVLAPPAPVPPAPEPKVDPSRAPDATAPTAPAPPPPVDVAEADVSGTPSATTQSPVVDSSSVTATSRPTPDPKPPTDAQGIQTPAGPREPAGDGGDVARPVPARRPRRVLFGTVLGAAFNTPTGPDAYVGGFEGGFSLAVGFRPTVPDASGGFWHGLEVELLGQFYVGQQRSLGLYTLLVEGFTVAVGYQLMFLGRLKESGSAQRGVGLLVAFTSGLQLTQAFSAGNATDGTIGGMFELLLPSLHLSDDARRWKLARYFLKSEIRSLPAAGVTFYGVGAGATF